MRVLVTGGCGYIGNWLLPLLLSRGHKVTCYDMQFFGKGAMSDNDSLTVIKADTRSIMDLKAACNKQDAVIELSSISNNEMYVKNYDLAHTSNIGGSSNVAVWADSAKRFIYASSVAVYGTSEKLLTEDSSLAPTTDYGRDKAKCEARISKIRPDAIIVRAASVCGHSSNMRFDTPINCMTLGAMTSKRLTVNGGKQKRCYIDIDYLCNMYVALLSASNIEGQVFNAVDRIMTMEETAVFVAGYSMLDGLVIDQNPCNDERSYMVSGKKARHFGFEPKRDLGSAIRFMVAHFDSGNQQYHNSSRARMRML